MKNCPNKKCLGNNPGMHADHYRYCYKCGKALVLIVPNTCNCGNTLARLDKYCPICGLQNVGGEDV